MTERIYNRDPSLDQSAVQCTRLVIDQWMSNKVVDRPSTNDFFFVYLPQRSWVKDCNGLQQSTAGQWICWGPQHEHYYGHDQREWLHSCFHVNGTRALNIMRRIPLNTLQTIRNEGAFYSLLSTMYQSLSFDKQANQSLIESYLKCLIELCLEQETQHDSDMQHVWQYIEQHFNKQLSLDHLAEQFHMSLSSLRQAFKERYQVSIYEHIIRKRMHEAAYLLQDQQLSIQEIATSVGYGDLPHFSRLFKKHYGLSPRAYRNSYRE